MVTVQPVVQVSVSLCRALACDHFERAVLHPALNADAKLLGVGAAFVQLAGRNARNPGQFGKPQHERL